MLFDQMTTHKVFLFRILLSFILFFYSFIFSASFKKILLDASFDRPIFLVDTGNPSIRFLLIEQKGIVKKIKVVNDTTIVQTVLDLTTEVRTAHNEEGLLGMCLDPKFTKNGFIYFCYSASNPRKNVYVRFTWDFNAKNISKNSKLIFLQINQPYGNHNGGMIAFGPDEYLYISTGDGGSASDPQNRAENLNNFLGKILRIDVSTLSENNDKYLIPVDNPFIKMKQTKHEIWAYGLRNVWRFSFDRKAGTLWAGDVGQNKWEEINIIEKGNHYGWNEREGFHSYQGNKKPIHKDPIVEHPRSEAKSITGGYVYRGKQIPLLYGHYIYGDFVTGKIWQLKMQDNHILEHSLLGEVPLISSFAESIEGELYLLSFTGSIFLLQR